MTRMTRKSKIEKIKERLESKYPNMDPKKLEETADRILKTAETICHKLLSKK